MTLSGGLSSLYQQLAHALDGSEPIELEARCMLLDAADSVVYDGPGTELPVALSDIMSAPEAHPVCRLILDTALPWAPPQISTDESYQQLSDRKTHVELIGPAGLVESDTIRVGLYGILPNTIYGMRTHPAEEIFLMLAGEACWQRAEDPLTLLGVGERSYHPPFMAHATHTREKAFLSIYVWAGEVSAEGYRYNG